jgi:hypothetical protein
MILPFKAIWVAEFTPTTKLFFIIHELMAKGSMNNLIKKGLNSLIILEA